MVRTIFRPVVKGRVQVEPLNIDEYHRMIETGELPEDTSIELIRGFLTKKDRSARGEDPMTVGNRHTVAVLKIMRLMPAIEQAVCYLQPQQPIVLPPDSEPEPDASIIRGRVEDRGGKKPVAAHVECVIEVSDSSLENDREAKLMLYAHAGIRQYIIVNLIDDVVELYSTPSQDAGRYSEQQIRQAGQDFVLHLNGTSITVSVDSILP